MNVKYYREANYGRLLYTDIDDWTYYKLEDGNVYWWAADERKWKYTFLNPTEVVLYLNEISEADLFTVML